MEGRVLIGTSGYSYDDWNGPFYPQGLSKDERLSHYALFFPFVELNFSYYQMPTRRGLKGMVERTQSHFLFSIKAHKTLTHEFGPAWRDDAKAFREAVGALAEAGRLACVIVQLPYSFHHDAENRVYLAQLLDELKPLPVAVEFRNDEWTTERVYEELAKRGVAYLAVDAPELPNLPRPEVRATAAFSYVRFHGRNAENWWTGNNESRYDWDYSDQELRSWLPRIFALRDKTDTVFVAFNNHSKGRAVKNARQLEELVKLLSPTGL
jgi:uncharacterized protein YecE (DUF72 family)